jgi:glycosyltransferase involved in cell wall biosynthesis
MGVELTNQALISAVIPIAGFPNGTRQIRHWISSPELKNFEIILVIDSDDATTIHQVALIAEEIGKLTSVSILESTSRNPGGTRNVGLSNAKGKWITFWDCDDVPIPSKYLDMVNKAESENVEIAIGGFTVKSDMVDRQKLITGGSRVKILEQIAVDPGLWRFVFKAEIALSTRFNEMSMAEDQIYLTEALLKSQNFILLPESVYGYWQYEKGQLTKNNIAMKDLEIASEYFIKKYSDNKCIPILIVTTRILFTALRKSAFQNKTQIYWKFVLHFLLKPSEFHLLVKSIITIWKYR